MFICKTRVVLCEFSFAFSKSKNEKKKNLWPIVLLSLSFPTFKKKNPLLLSIFSRANSDERRAK